MMVLFGCDEEERKGERSMILASLLLAACTLGYDSHQQI